MKLIMKTCVNFAGSLLVALVFLAMAGTANICQAAEQQNSDDWQFMAELYLWYASIGGQATTGIDIDIGADDLIDGLNLAFMGNVGMKKDRWGFMVDAIYLNASDNQNLSSPTIGGVNTDVELSSWIVTPMVGYEAFASDQFSLNIVAGARYLYLEAEVDLRNSNPAGPAFNVGVSDSGSKWDGIIGVKGNVSLTTHWFIPFYFDIGTGNSEFTWQAFAGLGYRFKHFDILAGYRYLSWEFDDNEVFDDLNVSGAGVGIKFYF